MGGPWEDYGESGPWADYAPKPKVDTGPNKMGRAASLYAGAIKPFQNIGKAAINATGMMTPQTVKAPIWPVTRGSNTISSTRPISRPR